MESSARSSVSHQLSSATAGTSTPTTTTLPSPAVLVAGGVTAATLAVAAVLYLTSARSGAGFDDARRRPDAKPGSGILSRLWGALGSRGEAEPGVCVHAHATARDAEPDRDWVAEEDADVEEGEAAVGWSCGIPWRFCCRGNYKKRWGAEWPQKGTAAYG